MEKKKDYNLLKVILIPFIIFVILSWFIPNGSISSGEYLKGEVNPVGLYGMFTTPFYTFVVFAQYFILILCIGGFYGVLNKTCVYQNIIDKICNKFKNKNLFLIITCVVFGLITSLFSETIMVLLLLPFFATILLKFGFKRITCLGATIGSSLVGTIACITGNLSIYKSYFECNSNVLIILNSILFIILMFLLILFLINKESENKSEEKVDILLYENKKDTKKSVVPMCLILIFTIVFLVMGLYNWFYSFGISTFTDIHEKITTFELFGMKFVNRVFGNFSTIGMFSNFDVCAVLLLISIIIGWVYSVKVNDIIDSFKKGAKVMIGPGIYVILSLMVFSFVAMGSNNMGLTITNTILNLSNDFNVVTGVLSGMINSFFYNDFLYMMNGLYSLLGIYNTTIVPVIIFVFQSMFGIMMFILPVSITLIAGLKYFSISYKEWIKYIFKYLIQIFLICIICSFILLFIVK